MRIIRVVSQHIGNKTAYLALGMPQQKRQVIPRIFLAASWRREFGIQLFTVGISIGEKSFDIAVRQLPYSFCENAVQLNFRIFILLKLFLLIITGNKSFVNITHMCRYGTEISKLSVIHAICIESKSLL